MASTPVTAMVNTPITGGITALSVNTTPTTISANTLKMTITFIAASIFLLILVQYYPKYIIGLVLLVILSVFLYDYNQISSLLNNLGSTSNSSPIGSPGKIQ